MSRGNIPRLVSIYNYPEYLNPFYEDDQHKRLRFWKISSFRSHGRLDNDSKFRLGSFLQASFGKKSSSLGINKTSESPPVLRKAFNNNNSLAELSFRRRAASIRSETNALQQKSCSASLSEFDGYDFGDRNKNYRSTFHNGQKLGYKRETQSTTNSQLSLISTNPFESDYEIHHAGKVNKFPRKKRRAPLPPNFVSPEKPNADNSLPQKDETKTETSPANSELRLMTKEFEQFLTCSCTSKDSKSNSVDMSPIDDRNQSTSDNTSTAQHQSTSENVNSAQHQSTSENVKCDIEKVKSERVARVDSRPTSLVLLEDESSQPSPELLPVPVVEIDSHAATNYDVKPQTNHIEVSHEFESKRSSNKVCEDALDNLSQKIEISEDVTTTDRVVKNIEKVEINVHRIDVRTSPIEDMNDRYNHSDSDDSPEIKEEARFIPLEHYSIPDRTATVELRIDESEWGAKNSDEKIQEPIQSKELLKPSDPPKILRVREETPIPIAETEKRKIPYPESVQREKPIEFFKRIETVLVNQPTPPRRKKSLKDIIESINRNQMLLKASSTNPENPKQFRYGEYRREVESEKHINEMLSDLQKVVPKKS